MRKTYQNFKTKGNGIAKINQLKEKFEERAQMTMNIDQWHNISLEGQNFMQSRGSANNLFI